MGEAFFIVSLAVALLSVSLSLLGVAVFAVFWEKD